MMPLFMRYPLTLNMRRPLLALPAEHHGSPTRTPFKVECSFFGKISEILCRGILGKGLC